MKTLKLLFLIIAIIFLDNNIVFIKTHLITDSYAQDKALDPEEIEHEKKKFLVYDEKASNPKCGLSTTVAITVTTALVVTHIASIIAYNLAYEFKWMLAVAISMTVAINMMIIENMLLFACKYAFVRNPVLRDLKGVYRTCKNPKLIYQDINKTTGKAIEICPDHEYIDEDDYQWPKNRVPYSDFIEFCHREAIGDACDPSVYDCKSKLDPREFESAPDLLANKERLAAKTKECKTLRDGEIVIVHGVKYGASYEGDKICVSALGIGSTNWWPKPQIGCHLRESALPPPMCKKATPIRDANNKITGYNNGACLSCYIASACTGELGVLSHAPLAMTSIVVQCLKESLNNIIEGCEGDSKLGFLDTAKKSLSNAVKAALLLAVAIFGIKLALGAVNNYKEVMLFMVKIALVMYFALGNGMNYYYHELSNFSLALADRILKSEDSSTQICDYNDNEYVYPVFKNKNALDEHENAIYKKIIIDNIEYHTKDKIRASSNILDPNGTLSGIKFEEFLAKFELKSYAYLAIWDRMDCRIMFYLGNSISQGVGYALLSVMLIIPSFFFAGQIIITICLLLFVVVLLFLILWVVHVFILSLIALSIITLFAPLFIPMCLFQATKGFFDGWLKELITYALYPVVVFSFLGIMFAVFDKLYFDDLKFTRVIDKNISQSRAIYNYKLYPEDQCNNKYSNLACIVTNTNFITKPLIFGINITAAAPWGETRELWSKFAMLAIIGFFFLHFLKVIGGFAAELSGSFRANIGGLATGTTEMASNAAAGAIMGIKGVASKLSKKKGEEDKNKKPREGVTGGSKTSTESSDSGKKSESNNSTNTDSDSTKENGSRRQEISTNASSTSEGVNQEDNTTKSSEVAKDSSNSTTENEFSQVHTQENDNAGENTTRRANIPADSSDKDTEE